MGEREEGSDASGNGPAVFWWKVSCRRSWGKISVWTGIHRAVGWVRIGKRAAQVHDAPEGRPNYPLLLIVKILLLEQWYNLSNPQMEETLGDRISFRHFVGLGTAGGRSEPLDHQPVPHGDGGVGDGRGTVDGTGPAT